MIAPSHATARVHLATGPYMRDAQQIPGAVAAVYSHPLTDDQRREYETLKRGIAAKLRELGRADAAARFDRDIGAAALPSLPPAYQIALLRLGELGPPAGVFIAPMRPR